MVLAGMKSLYNERFSFTDPLSKTSACRKTRQRSISKAKCVLPLLDNNDKINHDLALSENESEMEISISEDENYCLADTESNDRELYAKYDDPIHLTDNPQSLEFELMMATDELTEYEEDDEDNELAIESINTPQNAPRVLDDQQQLLYKEASLSTAASNVLMMKYAVKHQLSWEALADLLQLVKLHCPFPNSVPSTLYYFKKHFKDLEYPTKHHYFCSTCLSEVSEDAKVCRNRCSLNKSVSVSSFIEVPVDLQLKSILERALVHVLHEVNCLYCALCYAYV